MSVVVCALGGAAVVGVACTTQPQKHPVTTAGAAGTTGSAGTPATGGTTGAAGDSSTGAAGSVDTSGTAGTTGAAGDSSAAGTTGAAGGGTTGAAGTPATTGAGGDPGAAGTTGAAGTGVVDNTVKITSFPVAVTQYWYPSGWDGDAVTKAMFSATGGPIQIEDQTTPTPATTGPCAKRVPNAIGDCYKITYTPVMSDAGATNASVALLPNIPQSAAPNFSDVTMAPHVPAGAMSISAEVAGDVGGEAVQFNLWDANSGDLFTPTFPAGAGAQTWQKLSVAVPAGADQELSPFGWGSSSTTKIVFYYDDLRINNTAP